MRRACGALIVAVAALIVCCSADPHREQDVGGNEQGSGKRYDVNDYRQTEEYEDFLKFLMNYGGASMLGRNLNGHVGKYTGGIERNIGRNGLGSSPLYGRDPESDRVARFVDSLGGGNFVRNLDSIGGGNFVRNLDSIGGSNFVKKNLDQLGGPNLVKKNLDSLGGGNFVRNLDSLGGGNFVRQLDPLGGGNFV